MCVAFRWNSKFVCSTFIALGWQTVTHAIRQMHLCSCEHDKIYQFDPGRLSLYYHFLRISSIAGTSFSMLCHRKSAHGTPRRRLCPNKEVPADCHHCAIDTNRHMLLTWICCLHIRRRLEKSTWPPDNSASQHEYVFLWLDNSKENPFSQEESFYERNQLLKNN